MSNVTTANRDIKSLQPLAQQAAQLFLDTCKARGIDIFVTEYHRSQARQDWLYEQGRSRPGKVVTWTRSSNHTSGYAWDIAVNPPHDLYDSKIIAKAGQVAKELGIEWGGNWKQQDTPHFQINKNWKAPRKDTAYEKAIQNLVLEDIIGSPAAWTSINLKNIPALVSKIGIKLFDVSTYDTAVAKMVEAKIINSPSIWRDKNYTEQNVRDLIVKVSSYLG
ncbi:MAG: M15 family metallopeptidase [Clostridiales bacterium]|nr:M15 family metallopeptidase [Clostridiales bacterium]MDU6976053.1 M15 family metallopeptidase [Clostridiales bacterium]